MGISGGRMADVYLAVAPMASPAKAETPWRRNAVLAAVTVAVVCVVALGVSSSEAGSKIVLVMNWEQQEIATVEHRTRRPSIPKAVLKAGGGLFKPTLKLHLGEIEDTMAQEESEQGADPTWIPDDEEAKLGPGMGENPEDNMSQEVQEESHDGTVGTTSWVPDDEEHIITK